MTMPTPALASAAYAELRLARIDRARRAVLTGQPNSQGGLEPWIERSWRRCLASGQRPEHHVGFDMVSAQAARRTHDASHALATAAKPLMDKLARTIAQTQYFAILTNAQGVVVGTSGDTARHGRTASVIARVGVDLSEHAIGTSAISAALIELQPVWLHRGEHFYTDTSIYSCAGAPVFNPDGQCAGMLDLTGVNAQERPELRHVAQHFARGIENALVAARPHALLLHLRWPGDGYAHEDEGLVALDKDGAVTGCNPAARQMLTHAQAAGPAQHIEDLFAMQPGLLLDAARRGHAIEVPLWSGLRVQVHASTAHRAAAEPSVAGAAPLKEIEAELIRKAVDEARGNVATAARNLGVSRGTVYRKLAALRTKPGKKA
jgi:transcriptional regulator of acetoin/glycerol metabolism